MGIEWPNTVDGGTLVPRLVLVPTGTYLSDSAATIGAASGLLHAEGTNTLVGPAKSFPLDIAQPPEAQANGVQAPADASPGRASLPGQQLGVVVASAAVNAAVGVLMELLVVPAASRAFAETGRRLKKWRRTKGGITATLTVDQPSTDVSEGADAPSLEVSYAEYRDRLLRMVIAASIVAAEHDFLAHAVLTDDGFDPTLGGALILAHIGNSSALNDDDLGLLRALLPGPRAPDGQYEQLHVAGTESSSSA